MRARLGGAPAPPGAGQRRSAGGPARTGDQGHGELWRECTAEGVNVQNAKVKLTWFVSKSPSHLLDRPQPHLPVRLMPSQAPAPTGRQWACLAFVGLWRWPEPGQGLKKFRLKTTTANKGSSSDLTGERRGSTQASPERKSQAWSVGVWRRPCISA